MSHLQVELGERHDHERDADEGQRGVLRVEEVLVERPHLPAGQPDVTVLGEEGVGVPVAGAEDDTVTVDTGAVVEEEGTGAVARLDA